MRVLCSVAIRRARVGVAVFVVSLVAMATAGTALASACAWIANPGSGNVLRVWSEPNRNSQIVGSMGPGREFYGSCTKTNGWITVNEFSWDMGWNSDQPPFGYVDGAYAYLL
jgi:hypothetical protein